MKLPALYIAGIGSYLPPVISAEDAVVRGWYDADSLEADGWTGACVAGDLSPLRMALSAATTAIDRSELAKDEFDLLMHASTLPQGPHWWSPQAYLERHAIARGVPALEIHQGCTGVFMAMELVSAYLAMPGRRAALVTCADNFGYDPASGADPALRWRYARNPHTARGSVLGDAGAALVLSGRGGFARILSLASRTLSDLEEAYRGDAPLFPPQHGIEHPLRLGERFGDYERRHPGGVSAALTRINNTRIELAKQALDEAGIASDRIARVVHIFSGTERYVKQFLEPIGIDPSRGILEFGRGLGHLGACDPIVGLEHLVGTRQVGEGEHVLLMSNGVSTAVSCAVVEILETPRWLS